RKCEDETIDNKYPIVKLDIDNYSYRTNKNIEFLDSVLIIQRDLTNNYGTQYTINRSKKLKKIENCEYIFCKKFLNNIHNEILQNSRFLIYDSIRRFYTLGLEVLLKKKSKLIKILLMLKYDECLLVPTQVNGVDTFEQNYLFERFKVKLEIETPVKYILLSVQNDISGAFEEYKNWICIKLQNIRKISIESTSE
ncbi:1700_t:CDS:2, partial [Gigaspora margarita]